MKLRVLDTFAGIGGFSLGLEWTGFFETVAFCEIEDYPQKVLRRHWPEVPIYDDIRTLTAERLRTDGLLGRPIDVITGGFPCSDLSLAGRRAGIDGEKSGLWGELSRCIGDIRPAYAVMENVSALLSGDRGRWFGRVLGDMAALGYCVEWYCLPAARLGAPHRRDRVWLLAYPERAGEPPDGRDDRRDQGRDGRDTRAAVSPRPEISFSADPGASRSRLADAEVQPVGSGLRPDESAGERRRRSRDSGRPMADADGLGLTGIGEPEHAELESASGRQSDGRGPGRRRDRENPDTVGERLERFIEKWTATRPVDRPGDGTYPAGWTVEPDVGRVAHGVPARVDRLKCLGNAIVPQTALLIGYAIAEREGLIP